MSSQTDSNIKYVKSKTQISNVSNQTDSNIKYVKSNRLKYQICKVKQTQISKICQVKQTQISNMIDLIDFWCFNATFCSFSNISAISWRPVLVVEESGENH